MVFEPVIETSVHSFLLRSDSMRAAIATTPNGFAAQNITRSIGMRTLDSRALPIP